jgi:hypothetical protein
LYNGYDQQIYKEFTRSNTLRSTNSDYNSQNGIATIYAPISHMNGTQTLTAGTPGISSRKSSGAASTIRKLFGSSTQRKVRDYYFSIVDKKKMKFRCLILYFMTMDTCFFRLQMLVISVLQPLMHLIVIYLLLNV